MCVCVEGGVEGGGGVPVPSKKNGYFSYEALPCVCVGGGVEGGGVPVPLFPRKKMVISLMRPSHVCVWGGWRQGGTCSLVPSKKQWLFLL